MLDLQVVAQLIDRHRDALHHAVKPLDIGGHRFDFRQGRYLTGVINLSTDSWYKESVCRSPEEAVERGLALVEQGAHMVDIGAESSLPDAARVDVRGQIERMQPVVEQLCRKGVLVSAESYHPEVLDACAKAGARVFNVTGFRDADAIFEVAAHHGAGLILCHVKGDNVREVHQREQLSDLMPGLIEYFQNLIARMEAKGVDQAFIDPGLGFYYRDLEDGQVRVRHQLETFLETFRLGELGYPTFNIVPHAPHVFGETGRRDAEPFFAVLAFLFGTHMIRTHEVARLSSILQALAIYPPVS